MTEDKPSRRIGRSILAVFAGFVLVVVLSLITDLIFHAVGVYPALGQPVSASLLLLATVYRAVYGVAGSYTTARLAPYRPMLHAMVGGWIGLGVGILGVALTWNRPESQGAHWYPIAVALLAISAAWAGGKICEMRTTPRPAAA